MDDVRRPRVGLLSARQVGLIVDEAHRVLEEIGVLVENEEAAALLDDAGARVDAGRAFIPRALCERCLESVPQHFTLYDRDGKEAFVVGGDDVHFDPGSAATLVHDFDQNRMRKPGTGDVIDFVTLTDRLEAMDAQSTGVVPGDVPEGIADRYRLFLALVYGAKPVVTGTFSKDAFATMHDMLCAVRGDASALAEKPLAVFDCCPTSPLAWSDVTSQALVDCARAHVPATLVPAPLIGATSPVTLSGTLVQHTAENLSGVVIHQCASPGAPLVYGGAATLFDMRKGNAPMSALEAVMVDAAYAQIGKSFGMPVHAYMGLSDAKTPDYQAGFETTQGALMAALAGVNIASGAGILNYVNCQSLEKLVLDSEVCTHARRMTGGIPAHDTSDAFDALREGVASKSFITSEHTRRFFREEIYYPGEVVERMSVGDWEAAGSTTAAGRAHEVVKQMTAAPVSAPCELVDRLETIMLESARAAGATALPDWTAGTDRS